MLFRSSAASVLWITGLPGMGKSTLIETWVQRTIDSDRNAIGAYFSFSGEQNKGMQDALGSMIVKLIERFHLVEELDIICQKLDEWPSKQYISSDKIRELFMITVKGAMKQQSSGSIVLGVDALDECKKESISELTRVFSDLIEIGRAHV